MAEEEHKLISQDCLDLSAVFADDLISQQLHVEARTSTDERIVEKQSVSRKCEFDVVKLFSSIRTAVTIVGTSKALFLSRSRSPEAITYEEFADLIYGPRLAVGDSPQEAQDSLTGICLFKNDGCEWCVIEAGDI